MTNRTIQLDARLAAVASRVREGVTLYDVGTDHAYLPVALVIRGTVSRAVASDVAEGPLACAGETVRSAGLSHRIETVLSDGLDRITLCPPCDVVLSGMGGDLMADILSRKETLREEGVRLILQPMTKPENLRRYLAGEGFAIEEELVAEEGKAYEILCCRYTGRPYVLSDEELHLGRRGVRREDRAFFRMVETKQKALKKAIAGRRRGGLPCDTEEALDRAMTEVLLSRKETQG